MVAAGSMLGARAAPARCPRSVLAASLAPTTYARARLLAGARPGQARHAAPALPEEPRAARRPAARRGRHARASRACPGAPSGPARTPAATASLSKRDGQAGGAPRQERAPRGAPGRSARPRRAHLSDVPGPQAPDGTHQPATGTRRLARPPRPEPVDATRRPPGQQVADQPRTSSSPRWPTAGPGCGGRCAPATRCSWRRRCALAGGAIEDVDGRRRRARRTG